MNHGIALLFTLLIIGVAVSLSIGVFNIILGELEIGEGARESQRAFYAADSGVECTLYWDLKEQAFVFDNEKAITCMGSTKGISDGTISRASQTIDGKAATVYQSTAPFILSNNTCVSVTVVKFSDGSSRISALGENTCNAAATRVVQRGVEVNY